MTRVEVESPLRFVGTQRSSNLGAYFKKRTSLADGRILVAQGLAPTFAELGAEEFDSVSKQGKTLVRLRLPGLTLESDLTAPCGAFSVPNEVDTYARPTFKRLHGPVRHVEVRGALSIYAKPILENPLVLRFEFAWEVVALRGKWIKLRARWSDGSKVRGWVPRDKVKISQGRPLVGGFGMIGWGSSFGCSHLHRTVPARFRIHAHAPIHDGAAGEIWAHTAGTLEVRAMPLVRPDGWVQIVEIRGLPTAPCGRHDRIWVHAKHLIWED